MKKIAKKAIAVLLSLIFVLFVNYDFFDEFATTVNAANVAKGDIIKLGTYPQSLLRDKTLIEELNAQQLNWVSYRYYSGNNDRYSMAPGDYMEYADVQYNGEKYRAVFLNEFRPNSTFLTCSEEHSNQDNNGFSVGNVYWFKFEPIEWIIVSPSTGLILSKEIIDSQAFNNIVLCNESDYLYYNNASFDYYASDYVGSDIRNWLNNDFYNCTFSAREKDLISSVVLDNDEAADLDPEFKSFNSKDNVFLLSSFVADKVVNNSDLYAEGTEYARCQGLKVYEGEISTHTGLSDWILRTPAMYDTVRCVTREGYVDTDMGINSDDTGGGIRPAMHIKDLASIMNDDKNSSVHEETTVTHNLEDNNNYSSGYYICALSTNETLTTYVNESFDISFSLYNQQGVVDGWKKMAIVVSNPSVISVSDHKENDAGYYVTVSGLSEGASTITVTDYDSGAYIILTINVKKEIVGGNSYRLDNVPGFYLQEFPDKQILTNFYLNGLYVNNYQTSKIFGTDKYSVSFDVYNTKYYYGSVDVYDSEGNWIECDPIKKRTGVTSIFETGEAFFHLICDTVTGDLFSYTANQASEKTEVLIEVPQGGYFTISNNIVSSPGTFLYNEIDIIMQGAQTVVDIIASNDVSDEVSRSVFEIIKDNDTLMEIFMDEFQKITFKICETALTVGIAETMGVFTTDFENLLNSMNISWKGLASSACGVAESVFEKATGPIGATLELCFGINRFADLSCQSMEICASDKAEYVTIHSPVKNTTSVIKGVVVEDNNGVVDSEAVLNVFKIIDKDEISISQNSELNFDNCEIYNICFTKNETLVQPNGKVLVKIPVPKGMDRKSCYVLRQEPNGEWKILDARIEGNYIVFETDHFSLYAVAGKNQELYVSSAPIQKQYLCGEVLNTIGLTLELVNSDSTVETISSGYVCSPTILSKTGTQIIEIRYGNSVTTFKVRVYSSEFWKNLNISWRIVIISAIIVAALLAIVIPVIVYRKKKRQHTI